MARFVVIKIDRDKEKEIISLTYTDLIDIILDATDTENSNPKQTSAENCPLYKDD